MISMSMPTDTEGPTMLGRPPWRRLLAGTPVALIAALSLAMPASGAAASTPSVQHPYRVGHFHQVGTHWNLKVEHRNMHGNRDVRLADPLNLAPGRGHRFVLIRVNGKLVSGVGGLGYDESFRLIVGRHVYRPAHVELRHGLPQSGVVSHGMVVMAKIPFLVSHRDLHRRMILRATSLLDWHSAPRYFRTTH
jgi:hypothetical protein